MRNPKDILVTTTEKIDGIEIIQYIKPISAHVVTGTGFFSDFAASFSDVFGGRSQSYQKQLSSIYNEAIETLKRTAYENGANCIVGLKVDLDEIAGKGKSMFMITAVGTAVVIEKSKSKKVEINEISDSISSEKMIEERERRLLIEKARNKTLKLNEQTWDFLTENNVFEIANEVFLIAYEYYKESFESKEFIYQKLLTYLYTIPEEVRTPLLYKQIIENESIQINSKFFLLIKELMAYDNINSKDLFIREKALQIITYDKPYYSIEDIRVFEKFIDLVRSNFKKNEIISQKKMLSSKEVELWVCGCARRNDINIRYCENCNKDIYGFTENEINPELAITKLTENIEIITRTIK